jgi:hypothetical protein
MPSEEFLGQGGDDARRAAALLRSFMMRDMRIDANNFAM